MGSTLAIRRQARRRRDCVTVHISFAAPLDASVLPRKLAGDCGLYPCLREGRLTLPGAIVTHVDYTHYALDWYIRQQANREQLPIFDIFGGTVTPEAIDSTIAPRLEGIAKIGKATLWLTQSHLHGVDDGHLMEDWLNRHYPIATEQYPTGIKLTGICCATATPNCRIWAARPSFLMPKWPQD